MKDHPARCQLIRHWLLACRAKNWNTLGCDSTYNILHVCYKLIAEYEFVIMDPITVINRRSDRVRHKKAEWTAALNTCTNRKLISTFRYRWTMGIIEFSPYLQEAHGWTYSLHANLSQVFEFFQKYIIPEIYLNISIYTECLK